MRRDLYQRPRNDAKENNSKGLAGKFGSFMLNTFAAGFLAFGFGLITNPNHLFNVANAQEIRDRMPYLDEMHLFSYFGFTEGKNTGVYVYVGKGRWPEYGLVSQVCNETIADKPYAIQDFEKKKIYLDKNLDGIIDMVLTEDDYKKTTPADFMPECSIKI